jgi:hypothetical protein
MWGGDTAHGRSLWEWGTNLFRADEYREAWEPAGMTRVHTGQNDSSIPPHRNVGPGHPPPPHTHTPPHPHTPQTHTYKHKGTFAQQHTPTVTVHTRSLPNPWAVLHRMEVWDCTTQLVAVNARPR